MGGSPMFVLSSAAGLGSDASQWWGRGKPPSPQEYVCSDWCLQAGQALTSAQVWGFVPHRTLTPYPVPAGPARECWDGKVRHKQVTRTSDQNVLHNSVWEKSLHPKDSCTACDNQKGNKNSAYCCVQAAGCSRVV